jgi:two-component system sensor histidine kinase KdpD
LRNLARLAEIGSSKVFAETVECQFKGRQSLRRELQLRCAARYAEKVARTFGFLLSPEPPPRRVGALAAVVLVALCTLLIYPLKQAAPVVSLGVVYMLAVVVVSVTWGVWLGVVTSLLSALAFNYFHLPPVGRLTISNGENWVALIAFVIVSMLASSVAEVTRARSREAAERRREADLAAEMARLLLGGRRLSEDLPTASARLSQVLALPSAAIELEAVEGDERRVAFPLREGPRRLGTLLVPADTPEATLRRLQERVVPALESLLSAALERDSLLADVVETAALRRTDVVKTALLRAVSHDLRSPLTAISAAADAVGSPSLSVEERREMAALIQQETQRLSRLVDNLLDLSRLEAGAAEPHTALTSVDEVIRAALAELAPAPEDFSLSIDRDLPLVSVDPVQLERAFVNVLENARRHSGGHPVSVRARAVRSLGAAAEAPQADLVADEERSGAAFDTGLAPLEGPSGAPAGDRLVVRIVDRGPGIPPAQLERVFEPFYRAGTPQGGHRGSGLGLAIARGFTESNGGRLHVESLPGQGATFVFELPLASQRPSLEPEDVSEVAASREQVH